MRKPGESTYRKGYMRYVVQQADVSNKNSWFATLAGYAIPTTSASNIVFGTKSQALKNAAFMMCLYVDEYKDTAKRYKLKMSQDDIIPYKKEK